jgi:peptide/nickel transport system permease protein
MFKYVFKRILMMVPVILGISIILFSVMNLSPGDPARLILGDYAKQSDVDQLREEMGLNENFFVRYENYLKDAVKGDLGTSYRTGLPVSQEIFSRFPTSLKLAFGSIFIAIVIGIPVGIVSAVKQYSIIDSISLISSLLLTSMPGFWLGLMLILFFALKLNLLPAIGSDTWRNYLLPSITLAASTLAILIRMTRSTMLEVIRQDYIRTAKAKGADENRIIFKHALRNALLPIITVIGINFGTMLGGSVIIEGVFAIPGIGTLMVDAVKMKDTPVVLASVMFVAILGGVVNLAVDILYIYIDPRIKSQYVKG